MKAMFSLLPALAIGLAAPAWAQQGPIVLSPAPLAPAPLAQSSGAPGTSHPGDHAQQPESVRTTTESLEYCKDLHGKVDNLMRGKPGATADQARPLSQEGERLCQHGQTRNGILHLRRAYVLLSKSELAVKAEPAR